MGERTVEREKLAIGRQRRRLAAYVDPTNQQTSSHIQRPTMRPAILNSPPPSVPRPPHINPHSPASRAGSPFLPACLLSILGSLLIAESASEEKRREELSERIGEDRLGWESFWGTVVWAASDCEGGIAEVGSRRWPW